MAIKVDFGKLFGSLGKAAGNVGKGVGKTAVVAGSGFFGGLMSGATGGKLGGGASASNSNAGNSSTRGGIASGGSFFGFSTSSNTRVNGPISSKDNCCCCDQTLSLLSSIDETLKRSLYVSQRLGLQNSEMMAEGSGNQKIAGLGGSAEALSDTTEKVGFGLGQMILSSLALFVAGNAGKIFDPNRNEDGGIDLLGGAAGALAGGALGGKKKIANAIIGGVTGANPGDGMYKAKSTEGMVGGTVGSVGGGILSGMAGGAVAGAAAGMMFGPGAPIASSIFALVGSIAGGIVGSGLFEDAGEAIGDSIAGKFNEEVDGEKIGEDAGKSFLNKTRDKINKIIISQGGTLEGTPGNNIKSLGQYISKYEANSDPNVYNRYDPSTGQYVSVSGDSLSDISVNDIMTKQDVKSNNKSTNMFAVGKYQYTPDTLKDLVDRMKKQNLISGNEGFTGDLQDKIFEFSIMNDSKFENLRKYLAGDASATQAAMLEVAKEWRAMPDPRTGKTYGDGSSKYNQSQVSIRDFSNFFDTLKPSINAVGAPTPVSSPIPLITPKTNTGQIDYFAINNQPQKIPTPPGQGTVLLPTPAPIMQPQKSPNVPYPVDGPRLPMSTSQYMAMTARIM
jgi:hypothetical protein